MDMDVFLAPKRSAPDFAGPVAMELYIQEDTQTVSKVAR
jgi:hypothetical protein